MYCSATIHLPLKYTPASTVPQLLFYVHYGKQRNSLSLTEAGTRLAVQLSCLSVKCEWYSIGHA